MAKLKGVLVRQSKFKLNAVKENKFGWLASAKGRLLFSVGTAFFTGLCWEPGAVRAAGDASGRLDSELGAVARLEDTLEHVKLAQNQSNVFFVDKISGPAGVPIPVRIRLPEMPDRRDDLLIFRSLPKDFKLSLGFRLGNRWVVSLLEVDDLTLIPSPGFTGTFQLDVELRFGPNAKSQFRRVAVEIKPASAAVTAEVEHTTAISRQVRDVTGRKVEADAEKTMLERASALIKTGDISGARLLYIYLANRGSAKAALALARTYDPTYLSELGVAGLQADVDQAKHWYQRAAELGNRDAEARLTELYAGTR